MDRDQYGLDGKPIYPRAGHFDHVTGLQLPTFHGKSANLGRGPTILLLILMIIAGSGLAYASHLFG